MPNNNVIHDGSLIIGVVSLIGAVHFGFAKNLMEQIQTHKTGYNEAVTSIRFFIVISNAMVGFMFIAFLRHLLLKFTCMLNSEPGNNFHVTLIITLILSFVIFFGSFRRIRDVKKDYGNTVSKVKPNLVLILFLISYLTGAILLYYNNKDFNNNFSEQLTLLTSILSFFTWMLSLAIWEPIYYLGIFLRGNNK